MPAQDSATTDQAVQRDLKTRQTNYKGMWFILLIAFMSTKSFAEQFNIEWQLETPFAPFGELSDDKKNTAAKWMPSREEAFHQWAVRIKDDVGIVSPYRYFIDNPDKNPWQNALGIHRPEYVNPSSVNILVRVPQAEGICDWSLDNKHVQTSDCNTLTLIKGVPIGDAFISVEMKNSGYKISNNINIEQKVIVAFGDSYASGEGNPDVPTRWKSTSLKGNSLKWLQRGIDANSQWLDNSCHRSFFSYQTFTALKIAAQDPKKLITYLHYACSGAEILDGFLTRQSQLPGANRKRSILKHSQLSSAVKDLCQADISNTTQDIKDLDEVIQQVINKKNHRLYNAGAYAKNKDITQCLGVIRIPDLVLLSIGGNDAGFSSLIAWAIAPSRYRARIASQLAKKDAVCPEKAISDGCKKPYDIHLRNQLARRFKFLNSAMVLSLKSDKTIVAQSNYPNPLVTSNSGYCGDKSGSNKDGPWASTESLIGWFSNYWHFNITKDESRILSESTIPGLKKEISNNQLHKFIVAQQQHTFTDHGWCNPAPTDSPLSLPNLANSQDIDKWTCNSHSNNPACWDGYKPSKRYIRTLNDSFLTQASSRKDGHNGAMHPNFWGHVAMAESMWQDLLKDERFVTAFIK